MDPVTITSGVFHILTGALESSKSLHETVQSFKNHERTIRELRSELESLIQVLESLRSIVASDEEGPVVSMLKNPVLRCHQICQEFNAVIIKCTRHSSGGSRTSFRDWTRIRYMGGDVRDFKDMLAGYKATIAVALGSLNMQTAQVTRETIHQHNEMIQETTADLEAHLRDIDQKLSAITNLLHQQQQQDPSPLPDDESTAQRQEEERQRAQQCLLICENATSLLQSLQDNLPPQHDNMTTDESSRAKTALALSDARDRILLAASELQQQLAATTTTTNPLTIKPSSTKAISLLVPQQLQEDQTSLLRELVTARQCLQVCSLAAEQASSLRRGVHVFDGVSAQDNSQQIIVTTGGGGGGSDLISAKNIRAGHFSTQWLGCISDASLQQLSADRAASFTYLRSPSSAGETDPSLGNKNGLGCKLREGGIVGIKSMSGGLSSQSR
ncbi:uncharacterized protein TRIREDRAFT_106437 [Trichoderma reesei QM6a]|uniref:Predicted protein n=2 Tax=Hypocrea jecorina TaxID=51453 RepID=G0RH50_HYPJQ|nr:uncharacterized protein TRIREDRAFT_106437 [Trichoderma reesei QM6a]EGR49569.1 predicted protein [Trichoderma reesei QM6a]ETS02954.1 hypothetical protein M419DRAFT_129120 [Trichoderma reesei RUT C-30]